MRSTSIHIIKLLDRNLAERFLKLVYNKQALNNWVWPVTPTNWPVVKSKKVWAVDVLGKGSRVVKGDKIIFYVNGTRYFQGIFEVISDWHAPTVKWADPAHDEGSAAEIDLKEIQIGFASLKKLIDSLEFIERRKLKTILHGNNKDFIGLVPLGYVIAIPEMKNRGGHQEIVYYLTEKGMLASLGFHSYKKNINLIKILHHYKPLGKRYKRFVSEFIKLQMQVCLAYYYVQGISLGLKKEHMSEYDRLRTRIIQPFEIRIENTHLEQYFNGILQELNKYRKIHLRLFKEKSFFGFLWAESQYVVRNMTPEHGFHGWYNLQFLTMLDNNLKQIRHKSRRNVMPGRSESGIIITAVGEPQFLYSLFQDNVDDVPNSTIENTMKSLGIIRSRRRDRSFRN